MQAEQPNTARAYLGSASCLFQKRLVLISEAQGAYFRSTRRFCMFSTELIFQFHCHLYPLSLAYSEYYL